MGTLRTAASLLTVLAAAVPALGAQQADTRPGLAVLPFENGGSFGGQQGDYDALRRGIAGIMVSELSQNPSVRLVDRAEAQRILDEQELAASGRLDQSTAIRVGRLVGARYMITGTFIELNGEFRLDARLINVETGEIMKVVRNDPQYRTVSQLYRIIQSASERIMAGTTLSALPASAAPAPTAREVPTEALNLYSRALLYEDRGDRSRAIEFYERALDRFPEFTEAKEGLKKARGA